MSFWNIALVDSSASMTSNQDSVNKGIIDLFSDQRDNTDRFTFITFNTVVKNIADATDQDIVEIATYSKFMETYGKKDTT